MLLSIIAVIGGFLLLAWSADRTVLGASATARNFGVSPLVIGLTIVGFGTSAPEMLVSTMAALDGSTGLAIGNALGSNITNIALVLGVTALVAPLTVRSETVRREIPILLAVSLLAYVLMSDGYLGRLDGALLLGGLVMMLFMVVSLGLKSRQGDPLEEEYTEEMPAAMSTGRALFWLLFGIVVMLLASRLLVWGAVNIAHAFGVSDLVIGLTVVAIGTSMPELMATVMSARKNEHDIALGNIIGSNMFNLLGVLGLPGLIAPGGFLPEVLSRDFPWMIGLTLVLFVISYGFRGPGRINRIEGGMLCAAYGVYMVMLYFSAKA
jgi:cation:H+ antiporter